MPKIIVNGREYDSLDELPADVRQTYEQTFAMFGDANKNNIPDIFEAGGAMNIQTLDFKSNNQPQQIASGTSGLNSNRDEQAPFFESANPGRNQQDDAWVRSNTTIPAVPQWDTPKPKGGLHSINRIMLLFFLLDLAIVIGVLIWQLG